MFQKMLENVRGKCPLIHNITNYVTVNDCANIVLACGASPIMSDDQSEVEEITTIFSPRRARSRGRWRVETENGDGAEAP